MIQTFAVYCVLKNKEKVTSAQNAIKFGRENAGNAELQSFVTSCEKHFKRKGFLTEKQILGLYKLNRRPGGHEVSNCCYFAGGCPF